MSSQSNRRRLALAMLAGSALMAVPLAALTAPPDKKEREARGRGKAAARREERAPATSLDTDYVSLIGADGFYPNRVRLWNTGFGVQNGGAKPYRGRKRGMSHVLQVSRDGRRVKFVTRNTNDDRRHPNDDSAGRDMRRSEIVGPTLMAGVVYRSWFMARYEFSDPQGMSGLGGRTEAVFLQLHHGSLEDPGVSKSPMFSLRIRGDQQLLVRKRGRDDKGAGPAIYLEPWRMGTPIAIGIELRLHPTRGLLRIWRDGVLIVDEEGTDAKPWAIGTTAFGPSNYLKNGVYVQRQAGTISVEFADYWPFQTADFGFERLVASGRARWPA